MKFDYMRKDAMNEFFKFDNSKFITSLENRGFYIAPKSRSNYQTTWFSLASSLNMEYFSENFSVDSSKSINNIPFIEAIAQNKVAKLLKSIGYQYIHLPSFQADSGLTKKNNQADIIITNKEYISEFSRHILNKTFYAQANNKSFDYILEELDKFIESGLCKAIPEFARTPLKESLQNIKTIFPELEEKANGYIKDLD